MCPHAKTKPSKAKLNNGPKDSSASAAASSTEIRELQTLVKTYETEALRSSLLHKTAKREADEYRRRLSEVEVQLNMEIARSQAHMQECGNMKDLTMRQLALTLEEGRRLISENTTLRQEMESLKNYISEANQRFANTLQMEEHFANVEQLAATYQDDHNRMESFGKNVLLLMKCNICFGTLVEPALFCTMCIVTWFETNPTCPVCRDATTKRPVVSILLNNLVTSLTGTGGDDDKSP
ncbi:hypothetical protein ARMSODRAFT_983712 [Armillaria solidipes]|uniref:Zinc finger C3HC4 RING-type domain-containing protein n=1 Tax=Armillaria solidipes TaxID=1076256 RepID=A0A2H3AUK7_9AGAR|nr:hypothetical protein ARMSODRAFT_983712 [Armillaria solidipes]